MCTVRVMRLALLCDKGGVGKTTTAVNLAAAATSYGHRVLLLDLDVDQQAGNAASWVGLIDEPAPGWDTYRLDEVPAGFSLDGYDHVILDVPPGRPDRIEAAMRMADGIIVPVGPHRSEVHAVLSVAERAGGLPMKVLITRAEAARATNREIVPALEDAGLEIFRTRIPRRAAISDSYGHHPARCFEGWTHYRELWRELSGEDGNYDELAVLAEAVLAQ